MCVHLKSFFFITPVFKRNILWYFSWRNNFNLKFNHFAVSEAPGTEQIKVLEGMNETFEEFL